MVIASGLLGRLVGTSTIYVSKPRFSMSYNASPPAPTPPTYNLSQLSGDLEEYFIYNNYSFVPQHGSLIDSLGKFVADSDNNTPKGIKLVSSLADVLDPNLNDIAVQFDINNGYTNTSNKIATVAEALSWDSKRNLCLALVVVETSFPVKSSFANALFYYSKVPSYLAAAGEYYNASEFKSVSNCTFKMKNRQFSVAIWDNIQKS